MIIYKFGFYLNSQLTAKNINKKLTFTFVDYIRNSTDF